MHCREIATGSNLEQGLQKCFFNAVDLRKIGSAPSVSGRHFGNAVGISLSMPPDELRAGLQNPAATVETTSHVPQDAVKPSGVSGAHYLSVLAAAAGAVRSALQALRADPNGLEAQAANVTQYLHQQQVQAMLASTEFVPVRDCALMISSWRHMPTDNVNFGGGKAKLVIGSGMPAMTRAVNVTAGPDGDGLMCIVRLPKDGLARVEQSCWSLLLQRRSFSFSISRQLEVSNKQADNIYI